jgi:putative ATP-dependent DNA ligase
MNLRAAAERLGISAERMERMLGRVVRSSDWPTPQLLRFDKAVSGIEAGTVVFDEDEIVYGYPKIRRAMMLSPAIKRHFSDGVLVEEKMNGHNVRVANVGGRMIALTRGGFICPYSTEVANDQIPPDVFRENPDLVLCGEMVGPKNPYVPKEVYPTEAMDFYLFDVSRKGRRDMEGSSGTHALAEEYGIRSVHLFGEFETKEAAGEIKKIIKELGSRGREGVVIKDPANLKSPIKYTSSESNCRDLEFAFRYYNDYGQDFFFSRVVREGFQAAEWSEDEDEFLERCLRLGKSMLGPMRETVEAKIAGDPIVQEVEIMTKDLQTAADFEEHFRRMGVRASFDPPRPCPGGYLVKIKRLVMSTNDKTESVIEGQLW